MSFAVTFTVVSLGRDVNSLHVNILSLSRGLSSHGVPFLCGVDESHSLCHSNTSCLTLNMELILCINIDNEIINIRTGC